MLIRYPHSFIPDAVTFTVDLDGDVIDVNANVIDDIDFSIERNGNVIDDIHFSIERNGKCHR